MLKNVQPISTRFSLRNLYGSNQSNQIALHGSQIKQNDRIIGVEYILQYGSGKRRDR